MKAQAKAKDVKAVVAMLIAADAALENFPDVVGGNGKMETLDFSVGFGLRFEEASSYLE